MAALGQLCNYLGTTEELHVPVKRCPFEVVENILIVKTWYISTSLQMRIERVIFF